MLTALHPFNVARYEPLVASTLTYLLPRTAVGGAVFGFGLAVDSEPAGIVLGVERTAVSAEIAWLYVARAHRHRGIGRALLQRFEEEATARGRRSVRIAYPSDTPLEELAGLLGSRSFDVDDASLVVCALRVSALARAPWMARWLDAPGVELVPWGAVTSAERGQLAHELESEPALSGGLSPFLHEPGIDADGSLALRQRGRIVAWFLTHPGAPDTRHFSLLGVLEELRGNGLAFAPVAESLRRQLAVQGDEALGLLAASSDNASMMRLIEGRFSPHVAWKRETRVAEKRL